MILHGPWSKFKGYLYYEHEKCYFYILLTHEFYSNRPEKEPLSLVYSSLLSVSLLQLHLLDLKSLEQTLVLQAVFYTYSNLDLSHDYAHIIDSQYYS